MAYRKVCPKCGGDGSGDGYGISGAGGVCAACRGTGEVTPTTYERLTRERADA